MEIRDVKISDAEQIADIYNYYVLKKIATFEVEAVSIADMQKRIEEITLTYPYLVLIENDSLIGYAYASQYKSRCAYQSSVEISVYVKNGVHQKGIGTILYTRLFEEIGKSDFHAVIAGISLPNDASVKLHEKFGMKR